MRIEVSLGIMGSNGLTVRISDLPAADRLVAIGRANGPEHQLLDRTIEGVKRGFIDSLSVIVVELFYL
jgi:hypothetical protein